MDAPPIPLWRQLAAAADVLGRVMAGQSGSTAVAAQHVSVRAAAQALSYRAMRQLGRAQALRGRLAPRRPPPRVDALLCLALALCWDEADTVYEPFTLVNQAVEAAKHDGALRSAAGFINGCLRRFLRERAALVAATDDDPVARWNHPAWWIARLRRDHPQHWQAVLEANNQAAPMALRVNRRRIARDAYLDELAGAGLPARALGRSGVLLERPTAVTALPGWEQGWVSVQDGAAQQAAELLADALGRGPGHPLGNAPGVVAGTVAGNAPGVRILDACAAPGGKTAHLLEWLDAEVTALDIDPQRGNRIHENLARLGLQATVLAADAGRPDTWWDGRLFDAILLDAPCTASGIVRRHPDVRWLRRESDIAQLATQQARLLAALWPLLRPGGCMLYCTCSVFRAEGEEGVQAFLAHNTDALREPAPGHLLPQNGWIDGRVPDNGGSDQDGFFHALLRKRALALDP